MFKLPEIKGLMRRRFLLNYRIDPELLSALLPAPFQPQINNSFAIGGICLIRLEALRPGCLPIARGLNSENAAHRFAVQWEDAEGQHTGVYIPRRDTNSLASHWAGGRLFSGIHHLAHFQFEQNATQMQMQMHSRDQTQNIRFSGHLNTHWPTDSAFKDLQSASDFFKAGSLGYSNSSTTSEFQGLELHLPNWQVKAFHVDEIYSSYFDDPKRFPEGSMKFDHALFMSNLEHRWHARQKLKSDCCE